MKTRSFALMVAVIAVLALPSCGSRPSGPQTWGRDLSQVVPSPSGTYTLKIEGRSVDYDGNGDAWWLARLVIQDSHGHELYRDDEEYATWFPFRFEWTDLGAITLYSGDVGHFVYANGEESWTKTKRE